MTDPPYDKAWLPQWGELAGFAARVLKPGGVFLTYSGCGYLPEVMAAFSAHLSYVWTLAVTFRHTTRRHDRRIVNAWRPVLVFAKGKGGKLPGTLYDVLKGEGRPRGSHPWEVGTPEITRLLEPLRTPGASFLDCCCGTGSFLEVARTLGYSKVTGIDEDEDAIRICRARLAETRTGTRAATVLC